MSTTENVDCTDDGVPITPGLQVWNYNYDRDRVVSVGHVELEQIRGVQTGRTVTWWRTERGLFDGSRLSVHHPVTGERPEAGNLGSR